MRRIPVSDIEQRIKHAVAEQLGIRAEEIKNEASFMDDLGADSCMTKSHRKVAFLCA